VCQLHGDAIKRLRAQYALADREARAVLRGRVDGRPARGTRGADAGALSMAS
jgi:hypothetical protein